MTQNFPTANLHVGDRLISPTEESIIQVVAERQGDPVVVDLLALGDGEEGDAFTVDGFLTDEDLLNAAHFHKVFEIEAKPGDGVIVIDPATGAFHLGKVVFTTPTVVSAAITLNNGVHTAITVDRDKAFVIIPSVHEVDWVPAPDDLFVVVNPNNPETYGDTVKVVGIDPANGYVNTIDGNGKSGSYMAHSLARYTRVEQLHVLSMSEGVGEKAFDPFDQVPAADPFGAEYTSAAVTLGLTVDLSDASEIVGLLFSLDEIQILSAMEGYDEELPTNMIGILLNKGRAYEDAWLRATLNGTFSDGFANYIPDATEFFKILGEVATEQAQEKVKRTAEFFGKALSGEAATAPDLDMASPAEIAFGKVTGFDPDLVAAVFSEELLDTDVAVLKEAFDDSLAKNSVEGRSTLKEAVDDLKADFTAEAAQAIDDPFEGVKEMLDAMFGEGNYTLVPDSELDDLFPTPPMGSDKSNVFAEAQKIADAISGESVEAPQAPEADIYSEVASVFGTSREEAKKAVYEAIYGKKPVQEILADFATAQATLTELQEAIKIARGDLRTILHHAQEVVAGLDAIEEDIHTLRGKLPPV